REHFGERLRAIRFERAFQPLHRRKRRRESAIVTRRHGSLTALRIHLHETGMLTIHVPDSDARVEDTWLDDLDQRFEVHFLARTERPVVVERQLDAGSAIPRRLLRWHAGVGLAETGKAPALEGRHEESLIRSVGVEMSWRHQAAVELVRVGGESRLQRLQIQLEIRELIRRN